MVWQFVYVVHITCRMGTNDIENKTDFLNACRYAMEESIDVNLEYPFFESLYMNLY